MRVIYGDGLPDGCLSGPSRWPHVHQYPSRLDAKKIVLSSCAKFGLSSHGPSLKAIHSARCTRPFRKGARKIQEISALTALKATQRPSLEKRACQTWYSESSRNEVSRCCGEFTVALDRREAWACGRAAAVAAGDGESGVMVALRRDSSTFLTRLESVARVERLLPAEWIHPDGNELMDGFREYAGPLVGEVQGWARL
jgi:hypothetical protein